MDGFELATGLAEGDEVFFDNLGFFSHALFARIGKGKGDVEPRVKYLVVDGGHLLGNRAVVEQTMDLVVVHPCAVEADPCTSNNQRAKQCGKQNKRGAKLRGHHGNAFEKKEEVAQWAWK